MRFMKHFLLFEKIKFFEITFYFLYKLGCAKLSIINKKSMAKPTISCFAFQKYLKSKKNGRRFYGITHPIFVTHKIENNKVSVCY